MDVLEVLEEVRMNVMVEGDRFRLFELTGVGVTRWSSRSRTTTIRPTTT